MVRGWNTTVGHKRMHTLRLLCLLDQKWMYTINYT